MKKLKYIFCLLIPFVLLAIPLEVKYGNRFAKSTATGNPIYERAKSYVDQGKFKSCILNYGNFIDHWQGDVAGAWGDYQYVANVSFMVGVPGMDDEGNPHPWAMRPHPDNPDSIIYWGPTVSESWFDRTSNQINTDWDAVLGSKGRAYSGEITAGEYAGGVWTDENDTWPLLATSIAPESWPKRINEDGEEERFWPGWYAVDTDPSSPTFGQRIEGRFTSDVDVYLEIDDMQASREPMQKTIGYPTGTRVYATVHSYSRTYAEDIIFVTMFAVNESDKYGLNGGLGYDYEDTYFGFYFDADMFSAFYNGGNRPCNTNDGDMMGYDLEYNHAYIYDMDFKECDGAYDVDAFVAVKLLDTPYASDTVYLDLDSTMFIAPGEELGLTDWHWFDWYNRPGVKDKEDSGGPFVGDGVTPESPRKEMLMYQIMSGDKTGLSAKEKEWFFHRDADNNLNPHFDSMENLKKEFPDGLDCTCMMSSGPFTFAVGDTNMFSFSIVMGENLADLNRNANMAQVMYDLRYQGFSAPDAPVVSAVSGWDEAKKRPFVRLVWGDESESSVDIVTGYPDFEGYKIYKSTDGGQTWGKPLIDTYQTQAGWKPIAQFDLTREEDIARYGREISGPDPLAPWVSLGSNTGLQHEFVDYDVKIGTEYTYSVVAYDIGMEPGYTIQISSDNNIFYFNHDTISVNQAIPFDFYATGERIGDSLIVIANRNIVDEIVYDTTWSTTNVDDQWAGFSVPSLENSKGTTPMSPQFTKIIPSRIPLNVTGYITLVPGEGTKGDGNTVVRIANSDKITDHDYKIEIHAESFKNNWGPYIKNPKYSVYDLTTGDTLVYRATNNDLNPKNSTRYRPVFDGLQVVFDNYEGLALLDVIKETKWTSRREDIEYSVSNSLQPPPYKDYAIIFGSIDEVLDTVYWNGIGESAKRPAPIRVVDLSTGERVQAMVFDFGKNDTLDYGDEISFLEENIPGQAPGSRRPSWIFKFSWDEYAHPLNSYPFEAGDSLILRTNKPLHDGDSYTFRAGEFTTLLDEDDYDMNDIKVVPNPYLVSATWEQSEYFGKILFTNLPHKCKIKIYTLTGDYVAEIEHDDMFDDSEPWDLISVNRQEIAPGLYVFAVETPDGQKHVGKFAVIR
ncbi:MAG: hypothetical protein WCT23_05765 [Candidatus Neomarinimicrobiota bacterium]